MKTFLVIVVTIAVTWIVASHVHDEERGREFGWFTSEVKAPLSVALQDIRLDMNAGQYQLAKAKMDVLIDTWGRVRWFHGFAGDDILRAFDKVDTNSIIAHPEPSGANGSHQ